MNRTTTQAEPTHRRRPLLRQMVTVDPSNDEGNDAGPVTVHLIVLADPTRHGADTATEIDLPELAEAGWIRHHFHGLEVCVRTIG